MSTKDDALIEKMHDAYWLGVNNTSIAKERMERALAVARKEILEEAAKVCAARAKEWANSYGDGGKDWAKRSMISAAEADRCAAAILALYTQEQNND